MKNATASSMREGPTRVDGPTVRSPIERSFGGGRVRLLGRLGVATRSAQVAQEAERAEQAAIADRESRDARIARFDFATLLSPLPYQRARRATRCGFRASSCGRSMPPRPGDAPLAPAR